MAPRCCNPRRFLMFQHKTAHLQSYVVTPFKINIYSNYQVNEASSSKFILKHINIHFNASYLHAL